MMTQDTKSSLYFGDIDPSLTEEEINKPSEGVKPIETLDPAQSAEATRIANAITGPERGSQQTQPTAKQSVFDENIDKFDRVQIQISPEQEAYRKQLAASNQAVIRALQARAQGRGPSVVDTQARQAQEAASKAAMSAQASARGRYNPALVNALQQKAVEERAMIGQKAVTARMQEQQQAQQQLLKAMSQNAALESQEAIAQGRYDLAYEHIKQSLIDNHVRKDIAEMQAAAQIKGIQMQIDANKRSTGDMVADVIGSLTPLAMDYFAPGSGTALKAVNTLSQEQQSQQNQPTYGPITEEQHINSLSDEDLIEQS